MFVECYIICKRPFCIIIIHVLIGRECAHSNRKYVCVIDHNVGEFGVVYKAHLLTDQDVGFTAVAVKTLKGIETITML